MDEPGTGKKSAVRSSQTADDFRWELARIEEPPWHYPSGIADLTLDSAIRRHVALVLRYTQGDIAWTAQELNINPSTLYRWRKRLCKPLQINRRRRDGS